MHSPAREPRKQHRFSIPGVNRHEVVSLFTCLSSFTFASQLTKGNKQSRFPWTMARGIALLVLSSSAAFAGGQTAHFDGALASSISGSSSLTGIDILAIAVDAAGDVIFTTQSLNPS